MLQKRLLRLMLEQSSDALPLLGPDEGGLSADQVDQVLAARGMLADSLLIHGLQKRHLVEYGVNRCASRPGVETWPVHQHVCMYHQQ